MFTEPLFRRLRKLTPWQQTLFCTAMVERCYPNFHLFCEETEFVKPVQFQKILDLLWESLSTAKSKIRFTLQVEKVQVLLPEIDDYDFYGVYPAQDAVVMLESAINSILYVPEEEVVHTSKASLGSVAMLAELQAGQELSEEQLSENESMQEELEIQWELLKSIEAEETGNHTFARELRDEIREVGVSNIGVGLE